MLGIKNIVLTGRCTVAAKTTAALRKGQERHFIGSKTDHLFGAGRGAIFARGTARQAFGGDARRANNHTIGMALGPPKKVASIYGLIRHQSGSMAKDELGHPNGEPIAAYKNDAKDWGKQNRQKQKRGSFFSFTGGRKILAGIRQV